MLRLYSGHWDLPVGFFCPDIQVFTVESLSLLLSPFLYLDLSVLGDDALIN